MFGLDNLLCAKELGHLLLEQGILQGALPSKPSQFLGCRYCDFYWSYLCSIVPNVPFGCWLLLSVYVLPY